MSAVTREQKAAERLATTLADARLDTRRLAFELVNREPEVVRSMFEVSLLFMDLLSERFGAGDFSSAEYPRLRLARQIAVLYHQEYESQKASQNQE